MQTLLGHHWHHLRTDEVRLLLETDPAKGLDTFEVRHRQERFGANVLTPQRGASPLVRFLRQFNNPLILILLASSVITAVLKDPLDAAVIFGVVFVNAIIGYVQEARAEQAIEALAQTISTEATVIRGGKMLRVNAVELVPGDLVTLLSGNKTPADLRLIRSRDLQVAEAALTGESAPVEKSADALLTPDTPLAERRNMAYASTLVTYGQATGIVIATGDGTEVGRISRLLAEAHKLQTPLTRKIAAFSRIVLYAILVLTAATFGIGVLRGQPAGETFYAAIALAVAMIPEGLPAALTVTLAIGVSRMARRRAIIRKLPAVETLGSTTVICSDKTGTLTQNQMTVTEIIAGDTFYTVSGAGYAPTGEINPLDQSLRGAGSAPKQSHSPSRIASAHRAGLAMTTADDSGALRETLIAGLLCNDSTLAEQEGRWTVQGDPTDGALIAAALKGGLTLDQRGHALRVDAIPFESQHQYMAMVHDLGADRRALYVKGAVEAILARSGAALDPAGQPVGLDADAVHAAADRMAGDGLRVLAFARRDFSLAQATLSHEDLCCNLTFLGLQGMIDPPRQEAIRAVQAAQTAGIRVKMITGDHALTAGAIAQQIGLAPAGAQVLTGRELAALSDEQLITAAEETAVFARVSPEQKLRLVDALQACGHVVAMTGDGVNDAPALKQADIGVAMGVTGTDVTKEAADMVLTDDNFATIEAAVEEGRTVFDNLTKMIAWTLPTNLGEGLVILAAIVLGFALPILPIQILWINMMTSVLLGLTLAMEPGEPDIMRRPPRDPRAPILTRALVGRVVLVGLLILVAAFGLFELELSLGAGVEIARTVAVNAVVVIEILLPVQRPLAHPVPFPHRVRVQPVGLGRRDRDDGRATGLHLPPAAAPRLRQRGH
ncbi:MAG: HAD-IC family P-type ATPase [Chloroflexi bacterium]|nr:HAD-IC family P-type ATPase [Chloroflexota bacterium]